MPTYTRRRKAPSRRRLKMAVASATSGPSRGSEHWHQSTFISVIRKLDHPAGRLTFAVPNGFLRTKAMRIRAWQEGMVAGVLDVFNPTPMGGYHGHWLEFKVVGNTLSPEQQSFHRSMVELGYRVDVVYTWVEALAKWADYLGMEIHHGE